MIRCLDSRAMLYALSACRRLKASFQAAQIALCAGHRPSERLMVPGSLVAHQDVQPFQVPGQAHQAPLAGCSRQTPQRELAKAQDFLDDANHRFDSALAQAIDGLTEDGPQL